MMRWMRIQNIDKILPKIIPKENDQKWMRLRFIPKISKNYTHPKTIK
jgi:hypothetical protein